MTRINLFNSKPAILATCLITVLAHEPATGKSAKEIFEESASSIVVILDDYDDSPYGSGVFVGENLVATNCHVIEGIENVIVRKFSVDNQLDEVALDAILLAGNFDQDVCLLHVQHLDTHPVPTIAKLGSVSNTQVGEEVFAIGTPEGFEFSLSRGVVSQLRDVEGYEEPEIQFDAAISQGSSGGGLFNENGELIGITTSSIVDENIGDDVQNLNFAVPSDWIDELISERNFYPLHLNVVNTRSRLAVEKIIGSGFDVNDRNEEGHPPLHMAACYNENHHIVQALIEFGADVNEEDHYGNTPLHFAASCNDNPSVLSTLIEADASINLQSDTGSSPLHEAAAYNENPEVTSVLLQAGANVDSRNINQSTPLMLAALQNYVPDITPYLPIEIQQVKNGLKNSCF